jgi:hypothetical protein
VALIYVAILRELCIERDDAETISGISILRVLGFAVQSV